jgi:hypothetical protein
VEEYFMYWFRLRHSIPEKVLADLFYVSVGSVDAILKTWCILINSVFMKLKNCSRKMILFAVLNFVLSIACSFVQVHLFWLLDQCLDKMRQYEKNQVKQDGKKINNTSQKSPHPEVTSLPVSELNNVEKIEV